MREATPQRVAGTMAVVLALSLASVATAVAEEAPPRTAFEENGGTAWTTLEQERDFLAQVDARSDRVSVTEIGRTPLGRPITMVQIGEAPPDDLAGGSTALLMCLQHGNEPASRESCLITLRDLAFDRSPETTRLLRRSTVLVVPTVNPDGRAANTRGNSQGVDVNRDHLALRTPEGQALARVLRDSSPDMVVDVHEYGGIPQTYDRDLIYLWPRNLNVDKGVYREARRLSEDYTEDAVRAAGYSTGIYGIVNEDPPRQVAGDEDERIFRNMAGLRHVPSMLTESYVQAKNGETDAQNRNRRVGSQVAALQGALDMLGERGPVLNATHRVAEFRATVEGRLGKGPFYLGGADNDPAEPAETVAKPPCSYTLTPAQHAEVATTLDLHGIDVVRGGDGVRVPMGQPARTVIPLLLDARADYNLVDATPVACR